jgi:hypothetical protein
MPNSLKAANTEQEVERRMDEAVRRALETPHKPNKEISGKKPVSPKAKARKTGR